MGEAGVLKVVTGVPVTRELPESVFLQTLRDRFAPATSPTGRHGLVISVVRRRLQGDLAFGAFVEEWWDEASAGAIADRTPLPEADASETRWLTTEHVLKRPRYGPQQQSERLKVIGTAYRREGFSRDAFFTYWRTVHAPISARVPGLGAYVVSEVVARLAGDVDADAFVEQWWPDEATLAATTTSPELAIAWADVANYAQTTGTFWLVDEHVLQAPGYEAPGLLEG